LDGRNKVVDLESVRLLRGAPQHEPDDMHILATADDLGAVIRAHLYVEFALGLRLGEELKSPNAKYADRVRLARKVGMLSDNEAAMLFELDSLRNSFAHQWNYEISPQRVQKFVSKLAEIPRDSFDELAREAPQKSPERERFLIRLALLIIYSSVLPDSHFQ
jgi:hypothetical protein